MKKIVISGSASLQKELGDFIKTLSSEFKLLDYPKAIPQESFMEDYPAIHKDFYKNIAGADVLLIFNHDKKGISGYIGAAGFAELAFGLSQRLVYGKNIELYLYKMPDKSVQCYDEVQLWLKLGWIKIWDK